MSQRVLIVNADDFGRSAGVNRGVIQAHEHGVVTSATLMVRWPAAVEAADYARRSSLGVGLHLDLGEWVYRDGEWEPRYEVLSKPSSEEAVAEEIDRQLERFESLMGRPPTHLDSHQHVHTDDPARAAVQSLAQRLGLPVRGLTPGIRYAGFHGQDGHGNPLPEAISVEALVRTIEELPPGTTELGCHPAAKADHPSAYGKERLRELEALCDPRVAAAIHRCGIALRSFADPTGLS
jgi:chitin disaccharide deacetylase